MFRKVYFFFFCLAPILFSHCLLSDIGDLIVFQKVFYGWRVMRLHTEEFPWERVFKLYDKKA